jgi:hypothetical protein
MTVAVFAVAFAVTAFIAATALVFAAALAFAALATAAALVTTFAAALAAFIAAALAFAVFAAATITATAALVTYQVAASVFKDEAVRTTGNWDRLAVTTPEFVSGRTRRGWGGNTDSTAHFIAPWAVRRWNHTAVSTLENISGRTFRTVLVEAGATATGSPNSSDTAGPCNRAAHAEHEKSNGENCRQALPHEKSLVL